VEQLASRVCDLLSVHTADLTNLKKIF